MLDNEHNDIDDIFKSKLYDFEAEVPTDAWENISSRLPAPSTVPLYKRLGYWAAAASFMLVMGGGLLYLTKSPVFDNEDIVSVVDSFSAYTEVESPIGPKPNSTSIKNTSSNTLTVLNPKFTSKQVNNDYSEPFETLSNYQTSQSDSSVSDVAPSENKKTRSVSDDKEAEETKAHVSSDLLSSASVVSNSKAKKSRWSFGTGLGSVSVSSGGSANGFLYKNTKMSDVGLGVFNAVTLEEKPKTDISHKTPISFGLGAGYALNDRWSLQSGLRYSYLMSEWTTNGNVSGETKQKLHFLGIPLALSYKIAEWNNFKLYASAGAMAEINVAGRLVTKTVKGDDVINTEKEGIRMKEPLFSVNCDVGVSYPLNRLLSVYAEVGAEKYFKNGSDIETIRTDKPLNVGLQLGFRFGM